MNLELSPVDLLSIVLKNYDTLKQKEAFSDLVKFVSVHEELLKHCDFSFPDQLHEIFKPKFLTKQVKGIINLSLIICCCRRVIFL